MATAKIRTKEARSCDVGARRRRVAKPRSSVTVRAEAHTESVEERIERFKQQFASKRDIGGLPGIAASLPTSAFYVVSAVAAAGAACAGYAAGRQAPLSGDAQKAVSAGAAIAAGGVVAAGASQVSNKRGQAAGIDIWNALVDADDPTELDPELGSSIARKYGRSGPATDSVKQAYSAYLTALPEVQVMIPPGSAPLRGDEHVKLREFLTSVALSDEDAAPVHIDVGRTFFRARLEVSEREEQAEGLRRFQKLVYVSSQLFGEVRSGFLTPWVGRFNVTPEQVAVAKRDGALTIMTGRIRSELGGRIPADAEALRMLRGVQQTLALPDAACATMVNETLQADMAARLAAAVALAKTRGSKVDYSPAVRALDDLLAESRAFQAIADADAQNDAASIVPGIGKLKFDVAPGGAVTRNDLIDLFRLYLQFKMREAGDALSSTLDADAAEIRDILSLPTGKADDVRAALVSEAYQRLLREAVVSGRLDEAESPAAVLNELIMRVAMPGELANSLHESMYRQKLQECLADHKIDDADSAALERTARLLCLTEDAVAAVDKELKGEAVRSLLSSLFSLELDQFGFDEAQRLGDLKKDLALSDEAALDIVRDMGRQELLRRINACRNKGNKLLIARGLKEVVFFSNLVLAPLVAATKEKTAEGASDDTMKAIGETMAKAKAAMDAERKKDEIEDAEAARDTASDAPAASDAAEGEAASTVAAAEEGKEAQQEGVEDSTAAPASADEEAGEPVLAQKEINVGDELPLSDRVDIYKTYLQYCMTGDVLDAGMGLVIPTQRDKQEFTRLGQLADVLGLGPMDTWQVQSGMAEESFKAQAEAEAPNGDLSPEGLERLKDMAEKLGLREDVSQKILRGITNKKVAGNLQSLKAQGQLTLDKLLELKEQDVDVTAVVSDSMRMGLYEKYVNGLLSGGEGRIDAERLLKDIPAELSLDGDAATRKAKTAAKGKARSVLVQAFALYRQKNYDEAVQYLNNLMACVRLSGGELGGANKWGSREEALDMYGLYCSKVQDEGLRDEMATALVLEGADSSSVREAVDAGTYGKDAVDAKQASSSSSIF